MKKVFFTLLTFIVLLGQSLAQNVLITEINYNNPSTDDYEFIELYNRGNSAVALENWTFSVAVNYTFPAYTLNPGEYVVIAGNAAVFEAGFGFAPLGWNPANNNALNNTGENIVLSDANGVLMDSVHYTDAAPWPTSPDGLGPTLVLCDVNADNSNPANWAAATTPTGVFPGGTEILGNPGDDAQCPTGPVIKFLNAGFAVPESAGGVFVNVAIANGNSNPTSVTLALNAASTATSGSDFTLTLPMTITFPAGVAADTQTVTVNLVDDAVIEPTETLVLDLTNPTNGAEVLANAAQFTLNIQDDDTPLSGALVITGVFDTQVESGGTWAKGCELQAIEDIPDLSVFSVGFANNGGGTDGQEVFFPPIAVLAGECIWIANDSTLFHNFFGFPATVTDSDAGINGDDAIELFENNQVIDVFGEITHSGGTLPWGYLDGWAYRKSGTGPDGNTFNINNWNFSGPDVFDLQVTNATATVPFPYCSYSEVPPTTAVANDDNAVTAFNTALDINILVNDVLPNALTSLTVTSGPANGTATANGVANITYTPDAGFCGTDVFTYQICDAQGCDAATVTVTVECEISYPPYNIGTVTTVGANGAPDSAGVTCQLHGIVYGIDYQGVNAQGDPLNAIQFYLIDGTGGISVFSSDNFGYTVEEGDEVIVQGEIVAFNCLTQITPDTLWLVSTGNALQDPTITTFIDEGFESELIELTNLTLVDAGQWLGNGGSFNVQVTNGTFTNTMRIDNDCELSSMPAPVGAFHARGLGGQFDSAPCDGGYQFFPRYAADIIPLDATTETWLASKISFYPNPVSDRLFVKSAVSIDEVTISNTLGQQLLRVKNPGEKIDVSRLGTGLYLVTFRVEDATWTSRFVKE